MRIDSQVEPLVREALAAAIARDPQRSGQAAQAIADQGSDAFQYAAGLCVAIDAFALFDLHGGRPTDDAIGSLAASFAQMETWADIDDQTARTFLTAIADQRDPTAVLPADVAVRTSFVIGGWLLSAFPPEERGWEEFLDEALAALEAAPDRP